MKFIYLVILGIVIVESRQSFSFLMNPKEIHNTVLQFKTNPSINQLSLRCDNLTYDAWKSYNYAYVEVSPEQRRLYECSDTNFTLTVSNEFTQDEIVIFVYDANNYYQEIVRFNFLSDNAQITQSTLNKNQAQLKSLSHSDNDFKITLSSPQAIYIEIIKCSKSYSELSVKGYDSNYLYHNVSKMAYKNAFFDVIDGDYGDYYYRLSQSYYLPPDVFIKYQTAPSNSIDSNKIKEYGDQYYSFSGYVTQGRIRLSIQTIAVSNNEDVQFIVVVSKESYESNYLICIQGDQTLYNQYGLSYDSDFRTFYQTRNYGYQDIEVDFPNQDSGWYNIRVTAIVNHGQFKQTITYEKITIYQSLQIFPDSLLVHILAPVIIACIALIGLIVGACRFSAKKKQMQQLELLQQYQSNMNQNIQIQSHPQY